MSSEVGVDEETVEKLGGSNGFNFLNSEDCVKIMTIFDHICSVFKKEGKESNHRDSDTIINTTTCIKDITD